MALYEIHRDILVQKDFSPVTPGFQSVTKYFTIILVQCTLHNWCQFWNMSISDGSVIIRPSINQGNVSFLFV